MKKKQLSELVPTQPRFRHLFRMACALSCQFLTSGVVYGWSALEPMLRAEGVYADSSQQDVRLQSIYVAGTTGNLGAAMFLGLFLDRLGPRATTTTSLLIAIGGLLLFAFSSSSFDGYAPGLFFFGWGSQGVSLSLFHLSNMFPTRLSFCVALISATFDLSSLVFVIYEFGFNAGALNLRQIFEIHACILCVFVVVMFLLQPAVALTSCPSSAGAATTVGKADADMARFREASYGPYSPSAVVPVDSVERDRKTVGSTASLVNVLATGMAWEKPQSCPVDFVHRAPAKLAMPYFRRVLQQMGTGRYMAVVVFLFFTFLRINWYFGTVWMQLLALSNDTSQVSTMMTVMAWVVPSGALSVPLVSALIDRGGFPFAFGYVTVLGILLSTFSLIPVLSLQYATMVVCTLGRTSLFGCYYNYVSHRFETLFYGILAGAGCSSLGIACALQIGLLALTLGPFGGDFRVINGIFLGLAVPALAISIVLAKFENSAYLSRLGKPAIPPAEVKDNCECAQS